MLKGKFAFGSKSSNPKIVDPFFGEFSWLYQIRLKPPVEIVADGRNVLDGENTNGLEAIGSKKYKKISLECGADKAVTQEAKELFISWGKWLKEGGRKKVADLISLYVYSVLPQSTAWNDKFVGKMAPKVGEYEKISTDKIFALEDSIEQLNVFISEEGQVNFYYTCPAIGGPWLSMSVLWNGKELLGCGISGWSGYGFADYLCWYTIGEQEKYLSLPFLIPDGFGGWREGTEAERPRPSGQKTRG